MIDDSIAPKVAAFGEDDGVTRGQRHAGAIVPLNPSPSRDDQKQYAIRESPSHPSPAAKAER